jgi:hypothetical protein
MTKAEKGTLKKWKDKTHYTLYAQKYDPLGRVIEESIENEKGKLLHKKKIITFRSQYYSVSNMVRSGIEDIGMDIGVSENKNVFFNFESFDFFYFS